jgi:hypothetical protein
MDGGNARAGFSLSEFERTIVKEGGVDGNLTLASFYDLQSTVEVSYVPCPVVELVNTMQEGISGKSEKKLQFIPVREDSSVIEDGADGAHAVPHHYRVSCLHCWYCFSPMSFTNPIFACTAVVAAACEWLWWCHVQAHHTLKLDQLLSRAFARYSSKPAVQALVRAGGIGAISAATVRAARSVGAGAGAGRAGRAGVLRLSGVSVSQQLEAAAQRQQQQRASLRVDLVSSDEEDESKLVDGDDGDDNDGDGNGGGDSGDDDSDDA